MASHRALVDEFYRRMNELDLTVTDMCAPDVEWYWPSSTPGADVFRGREQRAEGLTTWTESWGELQG